MIFILYIILIIFLAHFFYFIFFKGKNHKLKIMYSLMTILIISIIIGLSYSYSDSEIFIKNMFFLFIVLTNLFFFNYIAHFLTTNIKAVYNYSTYIIIFGGISSVLTLSSIIFDAYFIDILKL